MSVKKTKQSMVSTRVDFGKDGKQVDFLRVPHSRNSSAWGAVLIPITIVKNGDGPTVLFIGGSHGGEFEGPVSLMKLSRELHPEAIQGRVIIIPALNLPAVVTGQRLSPIDGKDMNRVFPGNRRGTITEVIAHYLTENVLPLCDAVIDLHSGGYSLDLVPYISMHYLSNEEQTQQTLAALKAFQAPVGLVIEEISGEGLLDYTVEEMGKVFLCAELGGAGMLSILDLQIAEIGIYNILNHFDITEGKARHPPNGATTRLMEVPAEENYHMSPVNGIYESFFELGQTIEAGEIVGQVHFVEQPTWKPQQIVAQSTGMLIGTRGPSQVEIGDCVAVLAQDWYPDR